jgi:hypothetical protein
MKYNYYNHDYDEMYNEIQALKEALSFYASGAHIGPLGECENGAIAREALEEDE